MGAALKPNGLDALRILIIDDNAQMRTILGTILGGVGMRKLHYAPDGRAGLQSLREFVPDIVYVDYEMPLMNGLDFISAVRAFESNQRFTPIIMLTGHSDLPRLNAARDRGVNEFLAKPVTAKTIISRLSTVIYKPRPFIKSPDFFGPERRRRRGGDYVGELRRSTDLGAVHEL